MADILLATIALTAKFQLTGSLWSWLLPESSGARGHRIRTFVSVWAMISLFSLLAATLAALIPGYFGLYTPSIECIALLLFAGAGAVTGVCVNGRRFRQCLFLSLPPAAVFAVGICGILLLPHRGEWIAGGWDPGVYMNEAAALHREGTFHPPDAFFHDQLKVKEQKAFTRSGAHRTERFPGVTVDSARKAFDFEFFRLTPSVFASFLRSGGTRALYRANTILAYLTAIVFAGLLMRFLSLPASVFGVLLFLSQPVWLYHTHVPVSEMLQLCLLCAGGFLLSFRTRPVLRGIFPVILAMLVLNRFSFLPFAGILLVFVAWDDMKAGEEIVAIRKRLLQIAALAVAGFIDYRMAPVSVRGWRITPFLICVAAVASCFALAVDVSSLSKRMREFVGRTISAFTIPFLIGAYAFVAFLWWRGGFFATGGEADNFRRLLPFMGAALVVLAMIGAWTLYRSPSVSSSLKASTTFLAAVTFLLLINKNIVDWYPWATRRYLPFTVPLLAILSGHALGTLWKTSRPKRWGAVTAVLICSSVLAAGAKQSFRAWKYTDYNGLARTLELVTRQIPSDAIVIVDHPRWGTPLSLTYGCKTLNGRPLWRGRKSEKKAGKALQAVRRLNAQGTPVYFLTSSDKGLSVYPIRFEAVAVWKSDPVTLQNIVQHPRAGRFSLESKTRTFVLHEFQPSDD